MNLKGFKDLFFCCCLIVFHFSFSPRFILNQVNVS